MIRPIVFLDTSTLAAYFRVKYSERMHEGILMLRDTGEDGEVVDRPILKEWKSARAFLSRFKSAAQPFLENQPVVLGKVWIETLPGPAGTPWNLFEDDYHQTHIRTRTCLIPTPDNYTMSGVERVSLGVGMVNLVEHRILHSELNLSVYPRVHLIVDVRRPEPEE